MDAGQLASESQDDSSLLAISQSLLDPDSTIMDIIVSFAKLMLGQITEAWNIGGS
jgi:hypothetical protein